MTYFKDAYENKVWILKLWNYKTYSDLSSENIR